MTTEPPRSPGYDTYREIKALMEAGVDEEQAAATVYAALRSTNGAVAESEARLRAESDLKFTELKTSNTEMQASNDLKYAELKTSQDGLGKDLTIRLLAVVLPVTGLILAAIGIATGLIIYALG